MVETAEQHLSEEELAELAVRCLTLNLFGMNLILPNTLVAEVTDTTTVNSAANTPEWLRGFISWRGRAIPLISFEQLLGQEALGRHDERRMVVLNTLNANPRLPFIAMEIQGLPHLSVLKHGMLEYDESAVGEEPVILSRLLIDGEQLIVPNLDVIERMLENLGISA
jgi:chemosensory pili system protein ChpC